VKQILAEKDVQEKLEQAGTFAAYQSPVQMATRVRQDYDKWGKVIRDKGISVE
jgi:tripartite-type tricarboxylate transporter receptor subunit TctC